MTNHTALSDRELLLLSLDKIERIEEKIFGNGQPGIDHRLTAVETRVEERNKAVLGGAGMGGAIATLITFILNKAGVL